MVSTTPQICNERRTVSSSQDPGATLTQHLMECHLEMYPVYSCNLCDFKTNKTTSLALLEHEKQFHPDVEGGPLLKHISLKIRSLPKLSSRVLIIDLR
jgi:hypothetical protein